ncbi:hypothetical protein [Domibacillus aminovorans]|uniref:Uncharacterized protein n=1 Tax=Domibacillus aminovorans TaxID=29332 RepID=A0A177LFD2_9BACI|nr:hypothetical protein [Domibacillus aminovorans]OAH63261.1 hypothetical protein AWH49_06845 [Domibacillus aminovorans]
MDSKVDYEKTIKTLKSQLQRVQLALASMSSESQKAGETTAFIMADLKMEQVAHQETLKENELLLQKISDLERQLKEQGDPQAS